MPDIECPGWEERKSGGATCGSTLKEAMDEAWSRYRNEKSSLDDWAKSLKCAGACAPYKQIEHNDDTPKLKYKPGDHVSFESNGKKIEVEITYYVVEYEVDVNVYCTPPLKTKGGD